ncbi:MAG: hypothetical protein JWO32_146, partial [Bacteroidetes bacterium]|nr:hypothetical protein [Bacteroidota bacterium]
LRLFIACADNKIYNYTIWGIRNDGFKLYNTGNEVILPITYCKIGLSDYLITADRKGKIHAFSRKGDGRIDFKNKLVEDVNNFELEAGNSLANTLIIYYDDKNHLINKISLTDKKEIFKVDGSSGPTAHYFSDFDNNKIRDFIHANNKKLDVYDMSGSKIYSTEINKLDNPFALNQFNYNNNTFITIYDKINSKINIINREENEKKEYYGTNLPLACQLFNDGKLYLLVVSDNKLKCYKL